MRQAKGGRPPRKTMLSSRLFRRLFLSYVSIVCAAFACYSAFVLSEAAIRIRADASRDARLRLEEFRNAMEARILDARGVAARIKSSPIVRDLYLDLKYAGRPSDLYAPYKCVQELKSARSTSSDTGIYDVLLMITGDERVFTSSDIIVLDRPFGPSAVREASLFRGALGEARGLGGTEDIRLLKDFVVYSEGYSYDAGACRGEIAVLFDARAFAQAAGGLEEKGLSLEMRADGRYIVGGGAEGERIARPSSLARGVEYGLVAGRRPPASGLAAATAAALALGLAAGVVFLIGAYRFSRSYYRPIGRISTLLGDEPGSDGRLDDIAAGVSTLIDEREGLRRAVGSALPFVRQAALHALLTGDLDGDEAEFLVRDSGLPLDRAYYLVAACNIAVRDGASAPPSWAAQARAAIEGAAASLAGEPGSALLYGKDARNLALILLGDDPEEPLEALYAIHARIAARTSGSPFVVTIGADEAREDRALLPAAYRNACLALDRILLEGRGSLFFYEPPAEPGDEACYFPADAQLRIMRALGSRDLESIEELLDELRERNRSRSAMMGRSARLMLYELYVATVRAMGRLGLLGSIAVNVEATVSLTTLEEAIAHYRDLYAEACRLLSEAREGARVGDEIVAYVAANSFEPGLALKAVSDRYGVGMKRISSLFVERFGMSYSRYVHSRRMAKAVELLKDPSTSLESVGARCGYASNLTFRRHFQREMGMNPSDYRKGAVTA